MDKDRLFPGAPPDAELTEEGWLVFGQESWTVEDWARFPTMRPGASPSHRGRTYASEEERAAARAAARVRWQQARHRKVTA